MTGAMDTATLIGRRIMQDTGQRFNATSVALDGDAVVLRLRGLHGSEERERVDVRMSTYDAVAVSTALVNAATGNAQRDMVSGRPNVMGAILTEREVRARVTALAVRIAHAARSPLAQDMSVDDWARLVASELHTNAAPPVAPATGAE